LPRDPTLVTLPVALTADSVPPQWGAGASIPRTPEGPPTLDFESLLSRGVALVQALGGDIWTDFNEHDPGVTILELLCYAITDLAYRTEHPIEDILLPGSDADAANQAFHTGDAALASAPVTSTDYRRLLYDQVDGVQNAWLVEGGDPTGA